MNDLLNPIGDNDEISRLEVRCAELYAYFQLADELAARAERNDASDTDTLRRRAAAWHADYEAAVRDLRRERDKGSNYMTNPASHPSPQAIRRIKQDRSRS